jgi:multiple sugar transport system substrate-binding protein
MLAISRRSFLRSVGISAGAGALASSVLPALAQDRRIRHFWWGNPDRDQRTFAAIDIFNAARPDIAVVGESVGFADYFPKLTTQIAGGNMPDVIQQGYGVIFEYIERGAVVPLDDFVGGLLDLSDIDQNAIDAGTWDGRLYALSIGANAHMAIYNAAMYEAAGTRPGEGFDPFGWTYDDVKRIGVAVTGATPEGTWGSDDNTANYQNFSDFVVQSGGRLYDDEGNYGATHEMLVEYWNIWKDIRDAGATPPARASAGLVNPPMSDWGIVTGQTATSYFWSNQLVGAQGLVQDTLGAAMYPNLPEMRPGSYIQPSQFVCLTRDSNDPEAAVTYMNAFVNDPEMTAVLGLERGIPANARVRENLKPQMSEAEVESIAFFEAIQDKSAPLPPPFPSGANEVEQTFQRIATGVLLEQESIEDAAADMVRQAEFIIRRAG